MPNELIPLTFNADRRPDECALQVCGKKLAPIRQTVTFGPIRLGDTEVVASFAICSDHPIGFDR